MPCRSDYLDPNHRERELQRAAKLMLFVMEKLKLPVTKKLRETAADIYAKNDYVPSLCRTIRSLNTDQVEAIVFDAHNATSRDLAAWWEEHQKADEAREAKEKAEELRRIKKEAILKKLGITEEELREVLK